MANTKSYFCAVQPPPDKGPKLLAEFTQAQVGDQHPVLLAILMQKAINDNMDRATIKLEKTKGWLTAGRKLIDHEFSRCFP